jgi:hypothetical protein
MKLKIMLVNQKLHNQPLRPSRIIDTVNRQNFGRGPQNFKRSICTKFGFIRPVVLKKKIFKDFRFFNQSEAMVAILDVGQGHRTP